MRSDDDKEGAWENSQADGGIGASGPSGGRARPSGEGCLSLEFTDVNYYTIVNRENVLAELRTLVEQNYQKSIEFKGSSQGNVGPCQYSLCQRGGSGCNPLRGGGGALERLTKRREKSILNLDKVLNKMLKIK